MLTNNRTEDIEVWENAKNMGLEMFKSSGTVKNTLENFMTVLKYDETLQSLIYNTLNNRFELNGVQLSTGDKVAVEAYIQSKYGLYNDQMFKKALNWYALQKSYNPIKKEIEAVEWDGTERCEAFLSKWLKCPADAYHKEVSRLIFAGGINRLYEPGCKFDTTVVLIGNQGCGKSSICQWLAIKEEYYGEVCAFGYGRETLEMLQGIFIGEAAELLALKKTKEQAQVKSFLTRQVDRGRLAYQETPTDQPRQCIFIATSNEYQFVSDPTGGRRWLPVRVEANGHDLYEHKKEVQAYILQCWAEALAKYKKHQMPCVAKYELYDEILRHQASVVEEDYRVGMIDRYIHDREQVCIIEVWKRALDNPYDKPTRKDSNDIAAILRNLGWDTNRSARFNEYGVQKAWEPIGKLPF